MTGGYRYQGTGVGLSGGLPGGGGPPPGQGREVVEEMGMTPEMETKKRMRMTPLPLPLKIQERFPPEDWTNGSGE